MVPLTSCRKEPLSTLRRGYAFYYTLFYAFGFMFFSQPRGSSNFGPEAPIFSDRAPGALILHHPKNLLILCAIEQVVLAEFRGGIEVAARSHLLVDVLGFDIEEERVCIRVQQLTSTG